MEALVQFPAFSFIHCEFLQNKKIDILVLFWLQNFRLRLDPGNWLPESIGRTFLSFTMSLQGYVDRRVLLILQDGRAIVVSEIIQIFNRDLTVYQGVLAGFDQKSNVVLSDCKERVYSIEEGVEEIPLGLYLVKGETMCVYLVIYFLSSLTFRSS